uniref:Uncharacterized protein n=1 Tax=Octopus bimaculoides TaxID=37653 RepID=A0A0L8FG18_OCTBM
MNTISRDINYFKFGQDIEMKKEKLLIKFFVPKFRCAIECLQCEILCLYACVNVCKNTYSCFSD